MGLKHSMAAEKEANKIGSRFMNSENVVSAMSSFYGKNLAETVHIHTDSAADSKTRSANRDAIASGNDIFFGHGILESNTPESKGLLAHEIAHTMQQTEDSGMENSVSYGSEQGGLLSFFKNLFGRGKKKGDASEAKSENMPVGIGKKSPYLLNPDSTDVYERYLTDEERNSLDRLEQIKRINELREKERHWKLSQNQDEHEYSSRSIYIGKYLTDEERMFDTVEQQDKIIAERIAAGITMDGEQKPEAAEEKPVRKKGGLRAFFKKLFGKRRKKVSYPVVHASGDVDYYDDDEED